MVSQSQGVALITGASSGIGAVYADRLAHRGFDLLLVARDQAKMEALASRLRAAAGRAVKVRAADLTEASALAAIEPRVLTDTKIAVLVNNAGLSLNGGVLGSSTAEICGLIALNITAPTILAAAAAKAFKPRGAGAIINIASVAALAPEVADAAYAGSKGYLLNLSLKLAQDLKESGVRVQAVLLGAVRTEIWERSGKDVDALIPGRVMEVGDLVDAALVGFDRGEVVTIPPLADEAMWAAYDQARRALAPHLSVRDVPERYRAHS